MNQRIDNSKVAQVALNYALVKAGGIYSEIIGNALNPLNVYGPGYVGGGIAALANDTRTHADQAKADESVLANLFIPGVAPYNAFKRLGYATRNPELRKAKSDLAHGKSKKQHDDEQKDEEEKAQTKAANAVAYALTKAAVGGAPGGFNLQNALIGAGLGAGGGALSGLLMPGKDDEDKDDTTGSAIQRGLLGGGLGGLLGGFGGNYLSGMFQGAPAKPNMPRIPESPVQRAIGSRPFNLERSPGAALNRLMGNAPLSYEAAAAPRRDSQPVLPPHMNVGRGNEIGVSYAPTPGVSLGGLRQDSRPVLSDRMNVGRGNEIGVSYTPNVFAAAAIAAQNNRQQQPIQNSERYHFEGR